MQECQQSGTEQQPDGPAQLSLLAQASCAQLSEMAQASASTSTDQGPGPSDRPTAAAPPLAAQAKPDKRAGRSRPDKQAAPPRRDEHAASTKPDERAADAKARSDERAADAKTKSDERAANAKARSDERAADAKAKSDERAADAKAKGRTQWTCNATGSWQKCESQGYSCFPQMSSALGFGSTEALARASAQSLCSTAMSRLMSVNFTYRTSITSPCRAISCSAPTAR